MNKDKKVNETPDEQGIDFESQIEDSVKKLMNEEIESAKTDYMEYRHERRQNRIKEESAINDTAELFSDDDDERMSNSEFKKKYSDVHFEEGRKKKRKINPTKIAIICIAGAVAVIAIVVAVVTYNSNSYSTNYKKGNEYFNNQDYQTAIEYYLKAENTDEGSRSTELLLKLGESYVQVKDYDKAISVYNTLIERNAEEGNAIKGLCLCYKSKGDIDSLNSLIKKYNTGDTEQYLEGYTVQEPQANISSGSYDEELKVTLKTDSGATMYYTLDGSTPDRQSTVYTRPINIKEGTTKLSVIAYNSDGVESKMAVYDYDINLSDDSED